jgi:hypothetical protein
MLGKPNRKFWTGFLLSGLMQPERFTEEKTLMKVGLFTLVTALLLALPAWAGSVICPGPDTDSDGTPDVCDNCSVVPNPTQFDGDSDGFGNRCDADFDNNGVVGLTDYGILGKNWNQTVPPAPTYVDCDENGAIGLTDFGVMGKYWNLAPGPACGQPAGVPCP